MIIIWSCHISEYQNLYTQKENFRIYCVVHQCCPLTARRSWLRFLTGVCVFSLGPVSSRYPVSPAIRNMCVIRLDLFYFHVMHMSVLKQKILPFPRSVQKASLPWSATRVFVIIPPEDISVSGRHFSKTYILYVLGKESGLWRERQTKKRSSFSISPSLWFSIEATLNKLLNPKCLPMNTLYGSFRHRCMNRAPKHLTSMSDVSRFPTLTLQLVCMLS